MHFLELRPEPAFCSRFMTEMALKNWFLCCDSYLVARDTSGLSSRLGRAIGMPLKVRRETQGPFPVATGILGFLSIFKTSQTSSPLKP